MKISACFVILSAVFTVSLLAQTQPKSPATRHSHSIRIPPGVAEKLLIHKAEIFCRPIAGSRIAGTVVVAFGIDSSGNVLHPTVISGPAPLQHLILDAVQKYTYKPYLLNGRAIDVETTDSVVVDLEHGCPYGYTIR